MAANNAEQTPAGGPVSPAAGEEIRGQLRGSTFLLSGRMLALGLNFAAQVLIARSLEVSEFGAFFYALSIVTLWQGLSTLGMKRGISRFVPIFDERNEPGKLLGTICVGLGATLLASSVAIALVLLWPAPFLPEGGGEQGRLLVYVLIFLVPLEGLDLILMNLFASFAESKAIFLRRYVLSPALKLAVVVGMLSAGGGALFLAAGYLAAEAAGFAIYAALFVQWLRRRRLLSRENLEAISFPAREVLTFSLATLSSDFLVIATTSIGVLLLGQFHGTAEVAYFRVVVPAARFNVLVMTTMAMLYTPAAARMFARSDTRALNALYWRTAGWVAVLTFPVFALTFALAEPVTVLLFGEAYRSSGTVLSILALGYYFSAALGYNGVTLKVLGKIRYTVCIDLAALVANLLLALWLIPAYGAVGAALSTAGTLIVHNLFKQAGLRLAAGLEIFSWSYLSFYLILAGAALGLTGALVLARSHLMAAIVVAAAVSALVLTATRKQLALTEVFPELSRLPSFR